MSEETYTVILSLKQGDASYPQDSPLIFRKVELLSSQTYGLMVAAMNIIILRHCPTVLSFTLNMEAGSSNN